MKSSAVNKCLSGHPEFESSWRGTLRAPKAEPRSGVWGHPRPGKFEIKMLGNAFSSQYLS